MDAPEVIRRSCKEIREAAKRMDEEAKMLQHDRFLARKRGFEDGYAAGYAEALPKFKRGLEELRAHPGRYRELEPANKWGTVESAVKVMDGFIRDARGHADEDDWERCPKVPLEGLWMRW